MMNDRRYNQHPAQARPSYGYQKAPAAAQPKPLPEEYVDQAERVMLEAQKNGWYKNLTTTKIRRLFSLLVEIYNVENLRDAEEMTAESVASLRMAQVRMLYEAGRDDNVSKFMECADLLPHLKAVGKSRRNLIRYFHYMEALVAYHKYYGGKEG